MNIAPGPDGIIFVGCDAGGAGEEVWVMDGGFESLSQAFRPRGNHPTRGIYGEGWLVTGENTSSVDLAVTAHVICARFTR